MNENKLIEAIKAYATDPENAEKNYALALLYEEREQTAAAISYFLRAAERTDIDSLAYECLLKIGLCFERQGGRNNSVRGAYKHAVCLLPHRPEAYFLLARFYERCGDHVAGYLFAEQGLTLANSDAPKLRGWVEYPGSYGLTFQKAVSAWWWGKPDLSRKLLTELWNDPTLDANHREATENNLKKLNVPYKPRVRFNTEALNVTPVLNPVKISGKVMDIVLQGPYTEDTDEIITEYLKLSFVHRIIVSCWEDDLNPSDVATNPRVVFVRNKKPEYPGTDNRNMQIVSSRNGLKEVVTKYAAKMRTDQLYDLKSMIKMYDFFMSGQRDTKIFTGGMYPNLLFHPRDHIFWGLTESLKNLYACPLEINGLADRINVSKENLHKYYSFYTRAETYIGAHYLARFEEVINQYLLQPNLYLWDAAPRWAEAHILSTKLTPKYFTSFPRKGIDFKWKRKGWETYPYDAQFESGERWDENVMPTDIDLGDNDETFKQFVYNEIAVKKLYEKFHEVEEGDVVVDLGANVGLFTYTLKDRKPAHVYCVEPSNSLIPAIANNTSKLSFPVTICNYGITSISGDKPITETDWIYGNHGSTTFKSKTFKEFIAENNIDHIDFFKIDCEGGEYDIFTEENYEFLTKNVGYISGEWHLGGLENGIEKFLKFRNLYLTGKNYRVFEPYIWKECTAQIHSDEFVRGYYDWWNPRGEAAQFQIYIDNRAK